jgi:hypothetical protein
MHGYAPTLIIQLPSISFVYRLKSCPVNLSGFIVPTSRLSLFYINNLLIEDKYIKSFLLGNGQSYGSLII